MNKNYSKICFSPNAKDPVYMWGGMFKLYTNAYENLHPSFSVEFHRGLVVYLGYISLLSHLFLILNLWLRVQKDIIFIPWKPPSLQWNCSYILI